MSVAPRCSTELTGQMVEAGGRHGELRPHLRLQGAVGLCGLFPVPVMASDQGWRCYGIWKDVHVLTRSWSFLAAGFWFCDRRGMSVRCLTSRELLRALPRGRAEHASESQRSILRRM